MKYFCQTLCRYNESFTYLTFPVLKTSSEPNHSEMVMPFTEMENKEISVDEWLEMLPTLAWLYAPLVCFWVLTIS